MAEDGSGNPNEVTMQRGRCRRAVQRGLFRVRVGFVAPVEYRAGQESAEPRAAVGSVLCSLPPAKSLWDDRCCLLRALGVPFRAVYARQQARLSGGRQVQTTDAFRLVGLRLLSFWDATVAFPKPVEVTRVQYTAITGLKCGHVGTRDNPLLTTTLILRMIALRQ